MRTSSNESDPGDYREAAVSNKNDILCMEESEENTPFPAYESEGDSGMDAALSSKKEKVRDSQPVSKKKAAVLHTSVTDDEDELPSDEETAELLNSTHKATPKSVEDIYDHKPTPPPVAPKPVRKPRSAKSISDSLEVAVRSKATGEPLDLTEEEGGEVVPSFQPTEITLSSSRNELVVDEAMHYTAILSRLRSSFKYISSIDDVCKLSLTVAKLIHMRHEIITGEHVVKGEGRGNGGGDTLPAL